MATAKKCFFWLNEHFEEVFLILTLGTMAVLIFSQTAMRFTFRKTPAWTQELAQFIQVYFVYLGASYAIRKNAHIRLTFVTKILAKRLHNAFDILSHLFFFVFCIILIYWNIKSFNQVSAAMQIPMFIPYLALPIGGILMAMRLVQKIIQIFSKKEM
jgi:C4-dicarboxylate transporter DctQ subunit